MVLGCAASDPHPTAHEWPAPAARRLIWGRIYLPAYEEPAFRLSINKVVGRNYYKHRSLEERHGVPSGIGADTKCAARTINR